TTWTLEDLLGVGKDRPWVASRRGGDGDFRLRRGRVGSPGAGVFELALRDRSRCPRHRWGEADRKCLGYRRGVGGGGLRSRIQCKFVKLQHRRGRGLGQRDDASALKPLRMSLGLDKPVPPSQIRLDEASLYT